MKRALACLPILVLFACATAPEKIHFVVEPERPVATFSIVAFDPETGDLGVAVQSKFFGVGSVVPYAQAGVGAIATQAFANTSHGPNGLRLLDAGNSPEQAVGKLIDRDPGRDTRQLGVVDAKGRAFAFTGPATIGWSGHVVGSGFACQGNILAGKEVVDAMAKAYRESKEPLPERLLSALRAGQAAGGDRRGRQSAALLVVRKNGGYGGYDDRYVDLRVEDNPKPIEELGRLLALHRKFFKAPPLPGDMEGFVPEPKPISGPQSSPRAVWEAWASLLRQKDFKGMYALHSPAYREKNPYGMWVAAMQKQLAGFTVLTERFRYAGTRRDGEKALVALTAAGAPKPKVFGMIRIDGKWYFGQ
jgi:uncharacterized Ntn-hydrolase superfamily protein